MSTLLFSLRSWPKMSAPWQEQCIGANFCNAILSSIHIFYTFPRLTYCPIKVWLCTSWFLLSITVSLMDVQIEKYDQNRSRPVLDRQLLNFGRPWGTTARKRCCFWKFFSYVQEILNVYKQQMRSPMSKLLVSMSNINNYEKWVMFIHLTKWWY